MVQKEGQAALEEPQGSPNPAGVPGAPLEPPGATAGPVPGGEETDTETETALGSRRFLCGVVEGESFQRGSPLGDGRTCERTGGFGIRGRPGVGWSQLALLCRLLPRPEEPARRGGGVRFLAGTPPGWGGAAAPGRGFCPRGLCWSGERPLMAAVRRGEGRPGTQRARDSSERLRRY